MLGAFASYLVHEIYRDPGAVFVTVLKGLCRSEEFLNFLPQRLLILTMKSCSPNREARQLMMEIVRVED